MKKRIYLDYNSTTPVRPEVRELMGEVLTLPGNPSSVHSFGRAARAHVERAREEVAALAGTHPSQIVFTSGATESNNMVLNAFRGGAHTGLRRRASQRPRSGAGSGDHTRDAGRAGG